MTLFKSSFFIAAFCTFQSSAWAKGTSVLDNSGGQLSQSVIMTLALGAMFYFLIWQPQNKQAKELRNLIETLKVNDEILTSSGIIGIVRSMDDLFIELEVQPGVIIKIQKQGVKLVYPKNTVFKKPI